jgi:hypothetical protein
MFVGSRNKSFLTSFPSSNPACNNGVKLRDLQLIQLHYQDQGRALVIPLKGFRISFQGQNSLTTPTIIKFSRITRPMFHGVC